MWCFVILSISGIVITDVILRFSRHSFFSRPCSGKLWRQQFPDVSSDAIRQYLSLCSVAFIFPEKKKFCLSPTDSIRDLYQITSGWSICDNLEIESFIIMLTEEYDLGLETCWHEHITLGEIFQKIQQR
jgi:hypothetical protein